MNRLLFSVIVPVYNAAATLEKCVSSILCQAPAQTQIILVNDGSTDASAALCDALAAGDKRVQVIHQANSGAAAARNAGLAAAKGDCIQFVDADDWLNPGLYTAALAAFETPIDVFFFGIDSLSGLVKEQLPTGRVEGFSALPRPLHYYMVDTGLFASPVNKIYAAAVVKDAAFDPALHINEDLLFNMQVLSRCRTLFFEPSCYYVCDDRNVGSLSRRLRTDLLDAEEYTRPAVLAFLAHCGLTAAKAQQILRLRQQNVATAQCSVLLGRKGDVSFWVYRSLFARALAQQHCKNAVASWAKSTYNPVARAVYLPCIRLRLCSLLAAACRLRNHL